MLPSPTDRPRSPPRITVASLQGGGARHSLPTISGRAIGRARCPRLTVRHRTGALYLAALPGCGGGQSPPHPLLSVTLGFLPSRSPQVTKETARAPARKYGARLWTTHPQAVDKVGTRRPIRSCRPVRLVSPAVTGLLPQTGAELLTGAEICQLLNIAKSTLAAWRCSGDLDAIPLPNGGWRYPSNQPLVQRALDALSGRCGA